MHHSFPNRIMPHSFSLRISAIFLTLIAFFPDIRAKIPAAGFAPYLIPSTPDEYKYAWVDCANLFWNMTPRIQVGAEYNIGRRGNFDRTHRFARRAELMCMFSF